MCLRDHLFLLPDPCCSPFLRLQLLRKDRSFLHVIWVTNNGRAWEGAGWETLPIRPIAIRLTDSRDGWAAGNAARTPPSQVQALRGWKVCNIVQGKEVTQGIYFSSSPDSLNESAEESCGQIPTMPCFPGLWKHIFRFNKHLLSIYYVPIQKRKHSHK